MPKEIQSGTHPAALAEEFGLTGRLPLRLDETVIPVTLVADVSSSSQGRACIGRQQIAPLEDHTELAIVVAVPFGSDPGFQSLIHWVEIDHEESEDVEVFVSFPGEGELSGFSDGNLGVDGNRSFRDRRFRGTPRTVLQGRSDAARTANPLDAPYRRRVAAGETETIHLGATLRAEPEQASILFQTLEETVQWHISVFWSELERR